MMNYVVVFFEFAGYKITFSFTIILFSYEND